MAVILELSGTEVLSTSLGSTRITMDQMLSESAIWWDRVKVPVSGSLFEKPILKPDHPEEIRVQHLRKRLMSKKNGKDGRISIERAKLMTASYRLSEGEAPIIRRAKAIAHVLKNIPISIEKDELLAGRPCAFPGAAEIDPEFHSTWLLDTVTLNGEEIREIDALSRRSTECYDIDPDDLKTLADDIIPYWKERTHQSHILNELRRNCPDALAYLQNSKAYLPLFGTGVCHTVQDYLSVMAQGLSGLKAEIVGGMEALDPASPNGQDYHDLMNNYQAMIIIADAVIDHAKRYEQLAKELAISESDPRRAEELREIARICGKVPRNPAESYWEALQSLHLMHILTHLAEGGASHSPGRLDQYLYPYLKKDLDEGKIDLEYAQALLERLFIGFNERINVLSYEAAEGRAGFRANDNITIGGIDTEGNDATNLMSHMVLEAYAHVHLADPPLSVRVHKNTPHDFLQKVLEALRLGGGMPKFISDEVLVPAFLANGVSIRDARNYADLGCQENVTDPNCGDRPDTNGRTNAGYFNLLKMIELAIFNGVNPENGIQAGPQTGNPGSFESMEAFFSAVKRQMEAGIRSNVIINNAIEYCFQKYTPSPYHNLMHPGTRSSGLDYNQGGCRYNWTGATGVGLANSADTLAVIDRLIYQSKVVGWDELKDALRNNWVGFEKLRRKCIAVPKYGMDEDLPDTWAKRCSDLFFDIYESYPTPRGGNFICGFYSMGTYVTLGKHTGPTPDGRTRGEHLADGMSPSHYVRPIGVTAAHRSVSKIDGHRMINGVTYIQQMNVSHLLNDREVTKWSALARTFINIGGLCVQYNVLNADELKEAKLYPDRYPDLLVRVGGYSALFTRLSPELQDAIIARVEQRM
jgi:formate C-acetyltransferase